MGLLLFAAIVGGYAARFVHLPRVVGYLLAGVALRFALTAALRGEGDDGHGLAVLEEAAQPLQTIKILALGLIMFVMGNVFEIRHVKSVGARVLKISLVEAAAVALFVAGACSLVWMFSTDGARNEVLSAGLLLGAVAIATAPAATLLVLREYDAKGQISDTILTMTAINNTVSILLFHTIFLVLCAIGVIGSTAAGSGLIWLDLLLTGVGSVVLGCALGFCFSVLYAKVPLAEFLLIFFAALIGLGEGAAALSAATHLSFNFLLTCLFFGAVFTNITLDSDPLHESLRVLGGPIFATFFVIAGYELHLGELGDLGLLGAVYVGMRVFGKYIGARVGARWAGWSGEVAPHIGLGMLCQAGVAIGLADFLVEEWQVSTPDGFTTHPLALHFKTVILGSVVMFELVGPVVLKSVAKRAGEVKAITLLRRRKAAAVEGDSVTRRTWQALLRTFGIARRAEGNDPDELTVRHIMRSNIKFLRASACLDDVLHFVEGSRFNHFPVVDEDGDFAGMIHFSDLREMIYDPHLRDLVTAVDLASPDDMVPADMLLSDLLERFKKSDFGSLVVVECAENRRVVGLVEQRDLLRVLHGGAKN